MHGDAHASEAAAAAAASPRLLLTMLALLALLRPVSSSSSALSNRSGGGEFGTTSSTESALSLASLDARLAAADFDWGPGEPARADTPLHSDTAGGKAGLRGLAAAARRWSELRYDEVPADSSWDSFECLCSNVEPLATTSAVDERSSRHVGAQ